MILCIHKDDTSELRLSRLYQTLQVSELNNIIIREELDW